MGYLEETYFTVSFNPIMLDSGGLVALSPLFTTSQKR